MSRVALINVTKSFGETVVVDEVSLTIESGEFIVFLGPSGCGKSTMLRMLAGLEHPDSGEIYLADRRIDPLPPGKRDIAMVFQNYALYPHMTVFDNLAFGLRNAGINEVEVKDRAQTAATTLEIDHLLERRPAQLSGGQRQRVAIARAIVKKPALFLFDEPLSNLDSALRSRTRVELAQMHSDLGATMVFVTHDQIEAMTLADRIVILNNQKIEQVGTPVEIYKRPETAFVAEFVGSPKMNILPCKISRESNGMAVAELQDGTEITTGITATNLPADIDRIGIRPEFIRLEADAPELSGRLSVVERLGERTILHVQISKSFAIVGEDAGMSSLRSGASVGLRIEGTSAHLFDAAGQGYHAEPIV